jgi:hypothetical protein
MAAGIFNCQLCFHSGGDHIFEKYLQRHGMSTTLVSDEEFAIAPEGAVIKIHMMVIIIAMKGQVKLIEAETLALLCIAFRFFDLADHS